MNASEIISFLKSNKLMFEENYAVKSIGLFGSFARGEANDNSDIDILVELNEPRYKYLFGIKSYLEKNFSRKVDLTRKGNHLSAAFLNTIEKEIINA